MSGQQRSSDRRTVTRRSVLTGLCGGIVAGGTVMAILDQSVGTAAVAVSLGALEISDESATTQDGTIAGVTLSVTGQWAIVGETTGSLEYYMMEDSFEVSASITDTRLWSLDDFAVATAGESKTVQLPVRVVFSVFDAGDQLLAQAEVADTATVTITHSQWSPRNHGDVGGEGSLEVSV